MWTSLIVSSTKLSVSLSIPLFSSTKFTLHNEGSSTSTGIMAFDLYESKGSLTCFWLWSAMVSPQDGRKLFIPIAFSFSNSLFTTSIMTLLATSVCPLLCRCSTEVCLCLIPKFVRNSSNPLPMNYFPLSEIKVLGISNWHTMFFQMNF